MEQDREEGDDDDTASETGELACGTWTRLGAPATDIGTDLVATTCRSCREQHRALADPLDRGDRESALQRGGRLDDAHGHAESSITAATETP